MKAGWEIKKLGEVVQVQNGYAFDSKKFSVNGQVPLIRIRDLKRGTFTETSYSGTFDPRYLVHKGDLLIGMDGEFGCHEWKGDPALLNQRVCRLQNFNAELEPRFLLYGINAYLKEIEEVTGYTTVKHLSSRQILNINFPIPPLSEQAHIVGNLDEAFASIATAKANAQKNLENAKAVFESHLDSVFSNRGEGWVEKKLGEVCEFQNGFAFKSNTFQPSGTPVLRISNIQGGLVDEADVVFVDPMDYREDLKRYRVVKGDLLIAMSGATTGKIGFNNLETEFLLNQRVGKFQPKLPLNKRFLYYYLSTKVEENLRISAGSAQPNLSTEQIRGFLIPLPSIEHQEQLVFDFDSLSEETSRLTSLYTQKLSALEDLKKSLLHQAFTGKL